MISSRFRTRSQTTDTFSSFTSQDNTWYKFSSSRSKSSALNSWGVQPWLLVQYWAFVIPMINASRKYFKKTAIFNSFQVFLLTLANLIWFATQVDHFLYTQILNEAKEEWLVNSPHYRHSNVRPVSFGAGFLLKSL